MQNKVKKKREDTNLPFFITTIGSGTVDTIAYNSHTPINIHQNEKQHVNKMEQSIGGGALNTAAVFASNQYKVAPICKIGSDFLGQQVIKNLLEKDIDTSLLVQSNISTRQSFIFPSEKTNSLIVSYATREHVLCKAEINFGAIASSDMIYISPVQLEDEKILKQIVIFAHQNKTKIACNPGAHQLNQYGLSGILPYLDLFVCNRHEALLYMQNNNAAYTPELFAKNILNSGVKTVVITCDKDGAYIAQDNVFLHFPAHQTNVVNTAGAGDAFGAQFSIGLLENLSLEDAAKKALKVSAEIVGQQSASKQF